MKYDEGDGKETKKLLKNKMNHNNIVRSQNHTSRELNLFSINFLVLLKTFNYFTLFYIILSSIFYFLIHYYGKKIIYNKTLRLEYDSVLYQNLFANFYFAFTTTLGFICISRKSLYYFCLYFSTIFFYSILFFISYTSNLLSEFFVNKKLIWFSHLIMTKNIILISWIISHFFYTINENRKTLQNSNVSFSQILHEINLRVDLMRFSYNNLIIKTKLNKIIPNLLFKKESFYYANLPKNNLILNSNANTSNIKKESNLNVDYSKRSLENESTFYRSKETLTHQSYQSY